MRHVMMTSGGPWQYDMWMGTEYVLFGTRYSTVGEGLGGGERVHYSIIITHGLTYTCTVLYGTRGGVWWSVPFFG